MMTIDSGTLAATVAWSDETMYSPSNSMPGRAFTTEPAAAGDHLDLVLFHQELHALVQLVHDRIAPGGDPRIVVSHLVGVNAKLDASGGHAVVELRRFEQGFRGDAADVEAGAAELVGLHQGDLQPELRGPDRGWIAAHPAPQDHNVKVTITH